jgi:hypothetical protein
MLHVFLCCPLQSVECACMLQLVGLCMLLYIPVYTIKTWYFPTFELYPLCVQKKHEAPKKPKQQEATKTQKKKEEQ